jgi:hypothetical protein
MEKRHSGGVIFPPYSIQILFSKYCSVEKWKIATVGRAIFPPTVFGFSYFSVVWKMVENLGGFSPHPKSTSKFITISQIAF